MAKSFVVKGLNPATGLVVVVTVRARSAADARQQAEASGLRFIVVKEGLVADEEAVAESAAARRKAE